MNKVNSPFEPTRKGEQPASISGRGCIQNVHICVQNIEEYAGNPQ
jgi:hypothetical protein